MLDRDDRPTVLIYAGDFDPSGEDILRDLIDRTNGIDRVRLVAVTEDQIDTYSLAENPGKTSDSRAAAFEARHGRLVQVEVEALTPSELRALFQTEINDYWEDDAYREALAVEKADRDRL
jgi:hypothetical protein